MVRSLKIGIKTNPYNLGNPQENSIIERINQVLGNLVNTYKLHEIYVYDANLWMGILAAAAFEVQSIYHMNKGKSTSYMIFGQ